MKTRVVFNQKGGVGKSTISTNLAAVSATRGFKTLLVDLDAQGNATHYVGVNVNENTKTAADLLKQTVGWFSSSENTKDFILATPFDHLHVLASSPELAKIERELESRYKMYKLKECLAELSQEYDHIFIDTPPNFGFYSKAALIAANTFLVPFDCDHFSAQAIDKLLENAAELRSDHNPELVFEGVIINQFNATANLPSQLIESLQSKGLPVVNAFLSASVKIRESHTHQKPMIHFAPKHKLTQQFVALFDQLK